MLRHVSGGLFSPAQPRRAGPAKGGQAPSQGVLLANPGRATPPSGDGVLSKGKLSTAPHKLQECLPTSPPCASRSLISLLSSSPPLPLGHPAFLATFRHPPEHLRPLAFALWPSNSSFSSAAASPQFSATGSTPSHKKTDLPGRPPSFCPDLAHARVASPAACQVSGP